MADVPEEQIVDEEARDTGNRGSIAEVYKEIGENYEIGVEGTMELNISM